ncbi:unnamed protein product [Peronospora belbahrii]|uniref:Uncharacterized protein n=1 Tax=Peronospora belbahrii TaxID=622444 RepID=A0AAU9LKL2_9STRA|nr:unnamed protein product [Peronospora belbahrii]
MASLWSFRGPVNHSGERSQNPPTTSAEEEEGEHRKLEKLAVEYNFLLKSQLEEQRLYYERLLRAEQIADCNQKQWKERVRLLEEQNARVEQQTALRIGDLEGQVRDLMFYLDTQYKVEQSALPRGYYCTSFRFSYTRKRAQITDTSLASLYHRVAQSKLNPGRQVRTTPARTPSSFGRKTKDKKN